MKFYLFKTSNWLIPNLDELIHDLGYNYLFDRGIFSTYLTARVDKTKEIELRDAAFQEFVMRSRQIMLRTAYDSGGL